MTLGSEIRRGDLHWPCTASLQITWDPEQSTGGSLLGSWGWKALRDRNTCMVWVLGGSPKISAVGCVT